MKETSKRQTIRKSKLDILRIQNNAVRVASGLPPTAPKETPCISGECDPSCNHCEDSLPDRVQSPVLQYVENIPVDAEFISRVQLSAQVMLQSAAELNNSIRLLERTFNHADEPLLIGVLRDIRNVAGNLSEVWQDLDMTLAAHDLTDGGAA